MPSQPPSQPLLALGMVIGPFNFAKRTQVRSTMLQSPSVLHGVVAWRFVVGQELLADERRRPLEEEASRAGDMLLLPGVLDGTDVAMPCSCIEKVYAWYTHALERWPLVRWIGKTEDDTYVNLEQLLFDLRGLARHPMVYYGLMNACGMPPAVAAQRLSSGFSGCFLGDFEDGNGQTALRDWPASASTSTRRFGGMGACTAGAAAPFATGPLDVQSVELTRALFTECGYPREFMAYGRAANRRADRCNKNHELVVGSLATATCDCVVGHWIGECRLNVTLADMSWTKAHHYVHRAGGMGWVAPSNASIAVHFLKKHTGPSGPDSTEGGEWLHVHNASAPVGRSAFPPLLYRLEQETHVTRVTHILYVIRVMCVTPPLPARADTNRPQGAGARRGARRGPRGTPSSKPVADGLLCHQCGLVEPAARAATHAHGAAARGERVVQGRVPLADDR